MYRAMRRGGSVERIHGSGDLRKLDVIGRGDRGDDMGMVEDAPLGVDEHVDTHHFGRSWRFHSHQKEAGSLEVDSETFSQSQPGTNNRT